MGTKTKGKTSFLKSRSLTTILILINILLLNYLAYGLFLRFDISKSGKLRVSSATKKILKNLPEKAIIEAFISSKIPESHISIVRQVRSFLKEYSLSSKNNVQLVFLDPDKNENAKQIATENGIQPSVFQKVDQESANIEKKYFALTLSYGIEKHNILDLSNTARLEYDLTNSLYKMSNPSSRKVGFLNLASSISLDNNEIPFYSMANLKKYVSSFYDNFVSVELEEDLNTNIKVLIIPTTSFLSQEQMYMIDQYIMKGGNVLLASSGFDLSLRRGLVGSPLSKEILDFFKHYGVVLGTSLVVEPKEFLGMPINIFQVQPYPAFVLVKKSNINQKSLLTKGFSNLFFPWTTNIELNTANFKNTDGKERIKSEVLVETSKDALVLPNVNAHPQQLLIALKKPSDESKKGKQKLAVHLKGKFVSFFKDKEKPESYKDNRNYISSSNKSSNFVAVATPFAFTGSSFSRMQNFASAYSLNYEFFQSVLDVAFGLEELAAVRNKDVRQPIIKNVSLGFKSTFTFINFIIPILIFSILGFFKNQNRIKLSKQKFKK